MGTTEKFSPWSISIPLFLQNVTYKFIIIFVNRVVLLIEIFNRRISYHSIFITILVLWKCFLNSEMSISHANQMLDVERNRINCNKLSIILRSNGIFLLLVQIMIAYFDRKELCFGSKFSVLNFRWFYLKRFLGIHAESHIKIRFELNRARQNSGQNVDGSQRNSYV